MTINFILNDPQAASPAMRQIEPHVARPTGRADFRFFGEVGEGLFAPPTDGFLFWQCREAALRAIDLWEAIDTALNTWAQNRSTLRLIQKVPNQSDLNAFYNRSSLSFFEFTTGGRSFFSGASTDVVAHEAGHAFLDQIRPDLWDSTFLETGAFHEAFGDCIAILTALDDRETRETLLDGGGLLRQTNFVESTAEDLSDGIRTVQPNHNAAEPRHAVNNFQWTLPFNLPPNGGPGALINEVHSFGMLFSGCFYDLITNIFANRSDSSEVGLAAAARTAGRLLAAAARSAPLSPRFFRAVGDAMVLADRELHGGVNEQAVTAAFNNHNIDIEVATMLAPTNVLSGRAPDVTASRSSDILSRTSRRDLVAEIGRADGQRFSAQPAKIGPSNIYMARHRHVVALDDVSERLQGVVAVVEEDVLLGESDGRAAILGGAASVVDTQSEAKSFVHSLIENGQVAFPGEDRGKIDVATHQVRKSDSRAVLRRRQFTCRCGHCRLPPLQRR